MTQLQTALRDQPMLPTVKRIASIDFLRGIAIIMMIFIHSLYRLYDYQWIVDNPEALLKIPIPLLALAAILSYFGMWVFFFVVLSGIVNAYSMTKKIANIQNQKVLLYKQIITGFIIILFGKIKEGFIGYWGYLGQALRSGDWTNIYPIQNMFFEMKALDIIGWCYIITGTIHYLLLRKEGYKKYRRNLFIYILLIFAVVIATPFISSYAKSLNWVVPSKDSLPWTDENLEFTGWPSVHVATANPSFKTWLLVLLVGANDPLFPYLAASFTGTIIGMTLAQKQIPKHFIRYGFLAALTSFVVGIILIVFHVATNFPASVYNKPPDIPVFLLHLGGQIAVIILFLNLVEFKNRGQIFANRAIVRFIRRWSLVSLTIFVLDIYELFAKWFLSAIISIFYPLDLTKHGTFQGISGLLPSMIFSLLVVLMYDLLIRIWALVDFTGSFEWLIVQTQALFTKQRSSKLKMDIFMNHTDWINFGLKKEKRAESFATAN